MPEVASGRPAPGQETESRPGINPFVLVPGGSSSGPPQWTLHPIFDGPPELRAVFRAKLGELSAIIQHIDVRDQRWRGPLFLHQSHDDGKTWKTVGPAKGTPAGAKFAKISKRGPVWRIADRKDGGFDVQRRSAKAWKTVSEFPWHACD